MNVIDRIARAIDTDDEDTNDQSERLIAAYLSANDAGRELVDTIFACLCGWKLSTLLSREEEDAEAPHLASCQFLDGRWFCAADCPHHEIVDVDDADSEY